jgi:hypothetical protein
MRLRTTTEDGTILRALAVLEEACSATAPVQTRAVRLALWVLRGKCPREWLVAFWDAAGTEHAIGRSQALHASYNGIVRRVRMNIPVPGEHGSQRQ